MSLAALFVGLLALIFLSVPVILAMGLVGLAAILLTPDLQLALFPQKMFTTLDSYSLLALPFFILAGELMTAGGISRRLVAFAETLVGHKRGGLAHSTIVSSMIFAGVSGSSTADTTAIGSVLIPAMKERGYKAGYAASLTAVAGTIGAIIPPSMTMIVYGSMANVSIGALFLGGIIPGILVGFALMGLVFVHSLDAGKYPELQRSGQSFSWGRLLRATVQVWAALLAPVIIIAGILGGVFTATEAGVIVCVYAFLVSFLVYRTITLKDLPRLLVNAAVMTSMVSGIIGIAGGFGWFLSYSNFNQLVLNGILEITDNRLVIFFMLIGVMLILTMFVDSMAILIITVPIAVFIAQRFDIDPVHLGLAVVMATQIGSTTPPVAVLLFVASSIAKCPYRETIRYCLPFILAEIGVLVLVILAPPLVTWIPSLVLN
jgi:tripartite ATP-independent transporter DctM subunit